jgi:hypothetical protein
MADSTKSPRLTILGGPLSGRELTLDEAVDNILIGSDSSCRFHLDVPGVSPIHARLWVDWQGVTVYDTGAPEGIYLNDDRVERSAPVRNGDILWLGPPGGADVLMIQCRVPARTGTPPPVALPVVAAPDAGATVVSAAADDVPAEDVTETVAFAPPAEPAPAEQETVWLTPDPVQDEPAASVPEFVSPFDTTDEDNGSASTVVLHAEEAAASAPAEPALPVDDGTTAADEAVKFEIDEPPAALAPPAAAFEDDIDEQPVDATLTLAAPAELEPEPAVAVEPEPEPEPAPMAYTPVPAAPARPAPARPEPAPRPAAPPARPAPPRAAPVVAPRPATVPQPVRKPASGGSSAGKWIALAAVALIVIGGGLFALYRFVLSPAPEATTTAQATPPATTPPVVEATPAAVEPVQPPIEPAATPPVEEAVTIVKPEASPGAPTPTPRATPTAAPTSRPGPAASATPAPVVDPRAQAAAQAAALVGQGDAALAEQRHDAALAAYAQALQLDPQNAQAAAGRARAQAAQADARRTFVAGRSVLVGARSGTKGPAGFDDEDVAVAKAPDYSGRVEFEASPRSVKAGDAWTVRVFLLNDGKKDFRVQGLTATLGVDGAKSPLPATVATREVATQKRALVAELSGTWREGTKSWSLEVAVTSAHGEVVRNTLSWR